MQQTIQNRPSMQFPLSYQTVRDTQKSTNITKLQHKQIITLTAKNYSQSYPQPILRVKSGKLPLS